MKTLLILSTILLLFSGLVIFSQSGTGQDLFDSIDGTRKVEDIVRRPTMAMFEDLDYKVDYLLEGNSYKDAEKEMLMSQLYEMEVLQVGNRKYISDLEAKVIDLEERVRQLEEE